MLVSVVFILPIKTDELEINVAVKTESFHYMDGNWWNFKYLLRHCEQFGLLNCKKMNLVLTIILFFHGLYNPSVFNGS